MSPRAAWRLESFGFTRVYDYVAGKLDWMAAGLPTEGTNAERPRAGDVARRDVPTCSLDERLGEVRERAEAAGFDACVVVNDERVVLGLLRKKELEADASLPIEAAMRPGPSTFRPFVPIEEMAHFLTHHDLANAPITTSDGRLVGLLRRDDAVRAAERLDAEGADRRENEEPMLDVRRPDRSLRVLRAPRLRHRPLLRLRDRGPRSGDPSAPRSRRVRPTEDCSPERKRGAPPGRPQPPGEAAAGGPVARTLEREHLESLCDEGAQAGVMVVLVEHGHAVLLHALLDPERARAIGARPCDPVPDGLVQWMGPVVGLRELLDPLGARAVEDHPHLVARVLELPGRDQGVDRSAEVFVGLGVRQDQHRSLRHLDHLLLSPTQYPRAVYGTRPPAAPTRGERPFGAKRPAAPRSSRCPFGRPVPPSCRPPPPSGPGPA